MGSLQDEVHWTNYLYYFVFVLCKDNKFILKIDITWNDGKVEELVSSFPEKVQVVSIFSQEFCIHLMLVYFPYFV